MRRPSCKQIEVVIAAYTADELPADERAAIAVHLDLCESCRELAEVWAAIPTAVRQAELEPLPDRVERRLLSEAGDERPVGAVARPMRRLAVGVALAAAVALALGAALWLALGSDGTPDVVAVGGETASTPVPAPGHGQDVQTRVAIDSAGRRVLEPGLGAKLVLDHSALAELDVDTDQPRIARVCLEHGYAAIEMFPTDRELELVVETPAGTVVARQALFSLEVASAKTAWVRVIEGFVETTDADGAETVSAGQQAIIGHGGATPASREDLDRDLAFLEGSGSASARVAGDAFGAAGSQHASDVGIARTDGSVEGLLRQARAYRRARDFDRAAATYQRLINTYPGSATATNCLVALGQMELGSMGRAGAALSHFEAYLAEAPTGVLAEEARAGRVRAQTRLARSRGVIRAATDYLQQHPDGRAVPEMLRRRGDAHRRLGACSAAAGDYRRVGERWPGSTEAELSSKGLDACAAGP